MSSSFTSDNVTRWVLGILGERCGKFRIDDRVFESDSVHILGSNGTFTITFEEWSDEDRGTLETKLRTWAGLGL